METIKNSTLEDFDSIFRLYRIASDYQRSKEIDNIWPEFDPESIRKEIEEQRQFKLLIDNKIACIWALTYNDPEIWGAKDADPSVYIHRIATDPDYRGNNFVAKIVAWAQPFAAFKNRKFVRLDTCGHNEGLIKHYTANGFDFLGVKKLPKIDALPTHYHNAIVCYFEMPVLC